MVDYYKTGFSLHKYHGYSSEELDNQMPWERLILIDQIKAVLKEEADRLKQQQLEEMVNQR